MLTRRRFLRRGAVATTMMWPGGILPMALAQSNAASSTDDYRALVCVLLAGGNDSFNMLVPADQDSHAGYASLRADLALPRDELLPLSSSGVDDRSFGLHPGMPGLQRLYAENKAAFIANTGTLLEPMDTGRLTNDLMSLPLGLFSHSDQIQQWQSARSDLRIAEGWGGRAADLLGAVNTPGGISMSISLSGNNVFQSGATTVPYAISASGDGAPALNGYGALGRRGGVVTDAIDEILSSPQGQILGAEYAESFAASLASQAFFVDALNSAGELPTSFSDSSFSAALRQIARVINARNALGAKRQTFFITVGGWDHHDELLANQAGMLPMIDTGLVEFQAAMDALGVGERVTTFTISDFGRTLTSNGRGSDHGWGGHHIVVGGAVKSGEIYGDYPDIYPGNPLDVGRGIYAPTTSADEYFAELALWFGVSGSELATVIPNIGRFYDISNPVPPLGFLG
ncbi:MAG: DUF1501 domain-containing protein [Pseudomonadota bacterium]